MHNTDKAGIQFHILNRSKGAAVWVCSANLGLFFPILRPVNFCFCRDLARKSIENSIKSICRRHYIITRTWPFVPEVSLISSSTAQTLQAQVVRERLWV